LLFLAIYNKNIRSSKHQAFCNFVVAVTETVKSENATFSLYPFCALQKTTVCTS
jgi:hypothetical protein